MLCKLLFTFFSFVYCEETLLFAYSYTVAGHSYSSQKLFAWVQADSASLTPAGARQQYILGQELRYRFISTQSLLDSKYNSRQIRVKTLVNGKAIESAYALMLGMYPIGTGKTITNKNAIEKAIPPNVHNYSEWIKSLGVSALNYTYQAIPLELAEESTYAIDPAGTCILLRDTAINHSGQWREILKDEIEFISGKLKVVKNSISNVIELSELRDLILSGITEGQYIDDFYSDKAVYDTTHQVDEYIAYDCFLNVGNTSKIMASPMLRDVLILFNNTVNKALSNQSLLNDLKYISLIGIDTRVILAVLKQLNIAPYAMPTSASILLFELYQIKGLHNDIAYQIRYTYDMQTGVIPFQSFIEAVLNSTLDKSDFASYCNANKKIRNNWTFIIILFSGSIVILILLIGLLIIKYKNSKQATEDKRALTKTPS